MSRMTPPDDRDELCQRVSCGHRKGDHAWPDPTRDPPRTYYEWCVTDVRTEDYGDGGDVIAIPCDCQRFVQAATQT